ncbi:tagaturonate reductase [Thermoflavifilum thermophilum]|uniref:Tagaturonate reductase n=1 Tax=Thermoflavifilum thermophilum TaxID=1393122 RepID=A0A1I7N278_9BACT|nr:tagaturonate reductase [Thermoflavifilum thermophilum]SFV28774.1 tagaturonate reductase [Thermoflavifilum thermophilum]
MESLNRKSLRHIQPQPNLEIPDPALLDLPEKVLQFGTGVLLRGLPDYFIDRANKSGLFDGRILVVKSTSRGETDAFDQQDGLYTLCVKGLENGSPVQKYLIEAAISRVLSAQHAWDSILDAVKQQDIRLIISNTTEVGIRLDAADNPFAHPPRSFPGKLLAVLYARYQADPEKGFVIIPTELIPDNGDRLQAIVREMAQRHQLPAAFLQWMDAACVFCNSLVDRIVPGKLPADEQEKLEQQLGYRDELMIQAEPYRLWAIEARDPRVEAWLPWAKADSGVVLAPDITRYRELKLRLLNGTHTFSCGLAHLMGFDTVFQATQHQAMMAFLHQLMWDEIVPVVTGQDISREMAETFAHQVLERFANPFLKHHWIDISVEYTEKMRMRNVPLIKGYYQRFVTVPAAMALGFAAYLLFMKGEANGQHYTGNWAGQTYPIRDSRAGYFTELWKRSEGEQLVREVLGNTDLWQEDLNTLPGFAEAVHANLERLMQGEVEKVLRSTIFV